MAAFVDTNVILYAATDGPYRDASMTVLEALADGAAGLQTSTAVVEEVWHVERSGRLGAIEGLAARAYELFTPLLPVRDETIRDALALDGGPLGANDRVHVATCHENGIDTIITADAGFDRVPGLKRVDPLDQGALARLLRR